MISNPNWTYSIAIYVGCLSMYWINKCKTNWLFFPLLSSHLKKEGRILLYILPGRIVCVSDMFFSLLISCYQNLTIIITFTLKHFILSTKKCSLSSILRMINQKSSFNIQTRQMTKLHQGQKKGNYIYSFKFLIALHFSAVNISFLL